MMYPYMTLNDNTEITHSEMKQDGRVKVYIETPDEKVCFRHAVCWLPEYKWEDIYAYSNADIERFQEIIESSAHLIMEFSKWKSRGKCDENMDYKKRQMLFVP
jgi:hypothetical protein